jgi:hypothetical protein
VQIKRELYDGYYHYQLIVWKHNCFKFVLQTIRSLTDLNFNHEIHEQLTGIVQELILYYIIFQAQQKIIIKKKKNYVRID